MSYELNIIRKQNWDDLEEESSITLEEWLDFAKTDNELKSVEKEKPGLFEWTGYPEEDPVGLPSFSYYKGFIYTKNPNIEVIKKMLSIAAALNGRVYAEEGEPFDPSFIGH